MVKGDLKRKKGKCRDERKEEEISEEREKERENIVMWSQKGESCERKINNEIDGERK